MDDVELIKLIEKYPILYDKDSARSAKNAANKDAAWKTISLKLGASERACITRWKSIRDRFGKEFRRFQENPDSPTYWDMFPRLLFLKDHYKHGLVKHENLDAMKFEPRHRKPRRTRLEDQEKKQREEDYVENAEDIELCKQLIELVKLHPVLYDRHKIRISKNLSAKNDAWRAISESLSVSEELCYNRWKKLRDRFAREYRNHQINQSAPITWRYFNDLLFLGRHFRKGVPLIIENIKKRGRPPKVAQGQEQTEKRVTNLIWGADYPYSTDNDQDEDLEEEELEDDEELQYEHQQDFEVLNETGHKAHMEFVLDEQDLLEQTELEAEQQQLHQQQLVGEEQETAVETSLTDASVSDPSTSCREEDPALPTAEKLMGTVISNMETVLQQSRDCLQALQQAVNNTPAQTSKSLLSKVQMLLDGLNVEQRRQAERKIVHFLCECQIKTLDGQEIEDVAPCHVFN
ncbi:uncharacterized protein LOC6577556 [Drosophila mojavensis]|uniref:MADF domain-containing protein n=1 Tax=Drosophila mojavensis TaxID=7230 RepID=B4KEQ4_DROMO|nr:uncharacterized protein LOC6577556 [Drosophila mojavensis]EDW12954.1 uncharacterized protein Dmoj_GI17956 [Drosophila mojavensis]